MSSSVAQDRLRVLHYSLFRWCSLLRKRVSARCTRLVFVLGQYPAPLNACFLLLVEHYSGRVTEIGSVEHTKGPERTIRVILVGKYTLTRTVTAKPSSSIIQPSELIACMGYRCLSQQRQRQAAGSFFCSSSQMWSPRASRQ